MRLPRVLNIKRGLIWTGPKIGGSSRNSLVAIHFPNRHRAMLLAPFRAGSAHIVQLGSIRVEEFLRPFPGRRAEAFPQLTR